MHLLAAKPGGYVDDASVVVSLEQTPADIVILSAADTTLSLLATSCPAAPYPSVRLANLLHLRQPASVDLYMEEVLQHARVIVVDHLGGESYWPYGTEQLVALSRSGRCELIMFSGDLTEDPNLLRKSTADEETVRLLWRYLREGGTFNAKQFYQALAAAFFGAATPALPPRVLPPAAVFHPQREPATVADWQDRWQAGAPCVLVLFYRAHLQAANTQVFCALCDALSAQGLNPLPLAVTSLKDGISLAMLRELCRTQAVSLIINTTAFARSSPGSEEADQALAGDIPVLQAILAGNDEASWQADTQGLSPRDIAMHICMPEVDGRIITRAISFKGPDGRSELTQSERVRYIPHAGRIEFLAELSARWCRLRRLENGAKRLALVLANYPTKEGRLGNGVGLDTPASVINILQQLEKAGYCVADIPADGNALMRELQAGVTNDADSWLYRSANQSLAMEDYLAWFGQIPAANREALIARWGQPQADPMVRQGRFMIAGLRCGSVFVGIQPARGYELDLAACYHDPDLIPPHHYLAFYLWLRNVWCSDAVVHVGKHGNLEWLPGKSVALDGSCWPDLIFGPVPHLYPFIVNDPGEGSQAKRRAQAVIIDHLMPPLSRAETYGPLRDLERMVDEYYEALSLDARRAGLLRDQILQNIVDQDLHRDLGISALDSDEDKQALLNRTDAYLCELKEAQIRDGLHIFGQSPQGRLLRDTLLALSRHPVGSGAAAEGLTRALAADLQLGEEFDPLDSDWSVPWSGVRPAVLKTIDTSPWRSAGDTRERLELLALALLDGSRPLDPAWSRTQAVMQRIAESLRPDLLACGAQETGNLLKGLDGQFVAPGPSGAPSRGRSDVLPTGRNFYSVDTRAIPTQTSWILGQRSARSVIERYLQERGDYPRSIGLSVWGTATMRTGGDDIAQAFALMGVRPKWADGSHRVADFEIIPVDILDRPRVDVTLRVSGFFRDAFFNIIQLFDAAVLALAELDEPESLNPIRARIGQERAALIASGESPEDAARQASYRVFGAKPGAYGAGLQGLIEGQNWDTDADLAEAYLNWGGYAYGRAESGREAIGLFRRRLSGLQSVVQNQDNREHDLLDSDDYYQFQGGMTAAVRHLSGVQPVVLHGDHSNPAAPKIRTLEEEVSRVLRSRVANPKWAAGMRRHGYKGGFEMAATVDYLFAFDATARVVRDDQYQRVSEALLGDTQNRDFLLQNNPAAMQEICERLLEAMQRGLWQQPGPEQERIEACLMMAEEAMEQDA
ncbi:cobaltochelatase subunit CobN [Granulosicoccaceae sp. 1_MG-2023]|nr:cobaltochelatase subunit CobN [Granulosicoccaceae sp. 1_MG-2023]